MAEGLAAATGLWATAAFTDATGFTDSVAETSGFAGAADLAGGAGLVVATGLGAATDFTADFTADFAADFAADFTIVAGLAEGDGTFRAGAGATFSFDFCAEAFAGGFNLVTDLAFNGGATGADFFRIFSAGLAFLPGAADGLDLSTFAAFATLRVFNGAGFFATFLTGADLTRDGFFAEDLAT